MRKRTKDRRKKLNLFPKLWKIGSAVLVALLILDSYLLYDSSIFNIKTVDVKLDKIGCGSRNDIVRDSQVLGQKFFLLDEKKLEQKLKEKYFCIKSVILSKQFPNKVSLQVSGREPAAVLALLKNQEASPSGEIDYIASDSAKATQAEVADQFFVDSEGIVFAKFTEGVNVPTIYFWSENLVVGKKIGGNIVENSLKILDKIKSFGIDSKEAKIYSESILLINPTTEKPKIVFALNKDINIQLASLQLIMTQAKINEEEMEFIDLRFDKPVIKLIPKKK